MKGTILTIAMLFSSISSFAQTKKESYRCVIAQSVNGETTRIDTTFKTKAELDAFMLLQKVQSHHQIKRGYTTDSLVQGKVMIKTVNEKGVQRLDSTFEIREDVFEVINTYVPEEALKDSNGQTIDVEKLIKESISGDSLNMRTVSRVEIIRFEIRIEDPKQKELDKLIQVHNEVLSKQKRIQVKPEKLEVQLYPNPSIGAVNVNLKELMLDAEISLLDANGKLMETQTLSKLNDVRVVGFDLSQLAKGIYFVKVVSGKNANIQKLILK